MVSLQDRMMGMQPFVRGIDIYNEAIIVKAAYPEKWEIFPSEDGKIKVAKSENGSDETFYYADGKELTYNDILDLIEQTIKVNTEAAKKIGLLKNKIEELKNEFASRSYDELCSLTFSFGKAKRKYTKKKKESQGEEKVVNTDPHCTKEEVLEEEAANE